MASLTASNVNSLKNPLVTPEMGANAISVKPTPSSKALCFLRKIGVSFCPLLGRLVMNDPS